MKKPALLLVGISDADFPRQLAERARQIVPSASVIYVRNVEQLCATAHERQPELIVADDRFLGSATVVECVGELAAVAPVVLIAAYPRHEEIDRIVAAGRADFVPRVGDWQSLAASLIERRLRSMQVSDGTIGSASGEPGDDMGEIFRHEINNPLTGILGNAELLLAHSEKFPPAEAQRIRTVVELAVRLRETVRRVSDRWTKGLSHEW